MEEINRQELNKKLADHFHIPFRWYTETLDACFEWLVPRLSEDNYEVAISTEGMESYGEIFGQEQGEHYQEQASVELPALALCLAIEKLIDSKENE